MEYIDKQKALEAIKEERDYMIKREEWLASHIITHCGYRIIEAMPSADVEPSAEQLAKARAEGAEEAWEFVLATDEWDEDIRCYDTYAEAKAEFEKWEAAHKWEPKVGDVVSCYGKKGILLEIIGDSAYVMWKNEGYGDCELKDMSPTGEHVDISTIFEVLK